MANCTEETWEKSEEEEEEDGDLSFCDLPVIDCLMKEDNQSKKEDALAIEAHEEFDFNREGGSVLKESEMCAADEVFFQGQILPLRLSVSSDSGLGLTRLGHETSHNVNSQCLSRSGSMDHGSSTGGFTSNNSSRSSSTRSHNSTSSSSSNTTTKRSSNSKSKPRVQNNFLTCPSPKPQLRASTTRQGINVGSSRSRNSSTWDLFRLGLVPTPEIELQDLKVRRNSSVNKNSVSRNSSSSSSKSSVITNKNTTTTKINSGDNKNIEKQRRPGFLEKKIGGFLSGCKCTDETVSSSNVVIIKSSNNNVESTTAATHAKKEMRTKKKQEEEKQQQQQQQGKQAMSRHRTFEWVKDLSHAGYSSEISQISTHEQFPRMPVFF